MTDNPLSVEPEMQLSQIHYYTVLPESQIAHRVSGQQICA